MAMRMLQQQQPPNAILSALMREAAISRRQAYRYLLQAQAQGELQPVPQAKAVFTVNLPRGLIQAMRKHCRRQGRAISHVVAELLQRWVDEQQPHG